MTEAEWLECDHPTPMLAFFRGKASGRKLQFFAAACCRRVWHLLPDDRNCRAVELADRLADGLAGETEREAANLASYSVYAETSKPGSGFADEARGISPAGWEAAQAATVAVLSYDDQEGTWNAGVVAEQAALAASTAARETHPFAAVADYAGRVADDQERSVQADLLRCIFGNPFREVRFTASRLTTLARAAYEERILPSGELDPQRLAVLADALEEAGCDNADILAHLRGPGPHVRGCWALDLILGRE